MDNTQNQDEILKYAIQNSNKTFLEKGYSDKESIDSWLGQSLYYLYKNNNKSGFSRDSVSVLQDIKQSNVLNFLTDNYLENINKTEDVNIRDDFQKILKTKYIKDGENNTKDALKHYIQTGDASLFDKENIDEVLKYKPDSLIQAMGIITAKMVLEEPLENKKIPNFDEKIGKFLASDFAIMSNGIYDIDKIVGLMESIRSGKIQNKNKEDLGEK